MTAWIIAETAGIVDVVLGFFSRGGLFMWPLLICSIVSVTIIILPRWLELLAWRCNTYAGRVRKMLKWCKHVRVTRWCGWSEVSLFLK